MGIQKAISAFLVGLVGLLATFGFDHAALSPEVISSVSMIAATAVVYFVPNKG